MKIKDVIREANSVLGALGQGIGQAIAPQATADALRRQQAQARSRQKNPHIDDNSHDLMANAHEIYKNWISLYQTQGKPFPDNLVEFEASLKNFIGIPLNSPPAFKVSDPPTMFKPGEIGTSDKTNTLGRDAHGNYIISLDLSSSRQPDVEHFIASALLYGQQQQIKSHGPKTPVLPNPSQSKQSPMDMSKLKNVVPKKSEPKPIQIPYKGDTWTQNEEDGQWYNEQGQIQNNPTLVQAFINATTAQRQNRSMSGIKNPPMTMPKRQKTGGRQKGQLSQTPSAIAKRQKRSQSKTYTNPSVAP